jgi:hypothetical protein
MRGDFPPPKPGRLDILEQRYAESRKREGVLPEPRSSFLITPPTRIGELGAVVEIQRTEPSHG